MTIYEALRRGASFLLREESPLHISELLMAHVLRKNKEWLLINSQEQFDQSKWKEFVSSMQLYDSGKPLAYITNSKEFYGLDFYVDERVLIPRPETEMLVDEVISIVQEKYSSSARILDLGTGSGNIAISLASCLKEAEITASDLSLDALDVAEINAKKHKLSTSIKFIHSDLLTKFAGQKFDIIVANLPYIGTVKYNFVSRETLEYEPHVALFGGDNGLVLYKKMFHEICKLNVETDYVLGEFGFLQSDELSDFLCNNFDQKYLIKPDLAGIDRVFIVDLS